MCLFPSHLLCSAFNVNLHVQLLHFGLGTPKQHSGRTNAQSGCCPHAPHSGGGLPNQAQLCHST